MTELLSCFKKRKAFALIDVLVGTSLILVVFLGIFGVYQLGLKIISQSKARIGATAIANQKIEMIRNLPYEAVGVKEGYPSGNLEPIETSFLNNINYTISTRIDYINDSFDGIEGDSCPNDYKKAEVKVSWLGRFKGEASLVTDISPKDIFQECAEIGGTLFLSVFDASGISVSGANVEVVNISTLLTKNCLTDGGNCLFVLPEGIEVYKITVTKTGYSTERTYGKNETVDSVILANPLKPHATIFEGQVTSISFSIDQVSTLSVDTQSPESERYWSDSFLDQSKISESNNITVSGGEVRLTKIGETQFLGGTSDGDLCSFPGINGDCGQSFTMGSLTKEISQVQLYIRKTTTDTSDIYLEIRSDSTIGTVLGTSAIIASADISGSLSWISFTLPSPITLNANTQYFLRLRSQPDSTDPFSGAKGAIYWGYIHSATAPPAYGFGDAWRYIGRNNNPLDPGQQLGPTDQYDFSFKIYQGEYPSSGYLISTTISPDPERLLSWKEFSFTDAELTGTDLKYQLLYFDGTSWVLIPDADLAGNSTGFDVSPVDISGVPKGKYPQIRLKANFSTLDVSLTPVLYDWTVTWKSGQPKKIANVTFNLKGAKLLGTDADGNPVYKYSQNQTTNQIGHLDIPNLEWDSYSFSVDKALTGLDLISTEPPQPVNLLPNTAQSVILNLKAENTLLVTVKDSVTLNPIFAASVKVYNTGLGYNQTRPTDEIGQAFFIPLEVTTYDLEITASGYQDYTGTVSVSGTTTKTVTLAPL